MKDVTQDAEHHFVDRLSLYRATEDAVSLLPKIGLMPPNELLLAEIIQDAIGLLRWQSRIALHAGSWQQWIVNACAALDHVQQKVVV